jgi:hypothetical protein
MSILLTIGIILFVLWLLGLLTRRTMGGLVHLALVIAIILIAIWLLRATFKVF